MQAVHENAHWQGRSKGDTPIRLSLSGLEKPLEFLNCPEFAKGFASILRGWDVKEIPAKGSPFPLVQFRRMRHGYRWISATVPVPEDWREDPPESVVSAICDLHFELIEWAILNNPSNLCMHCAAVQMGDGLVVFPSPKKAGKSTLILQLAAAGHRIFCDDVLHIKPNGNDGMSLGLVPRIRLPLPPAIAEELEDFLADRSGPKSHKYHYIDLAKDELAPLGETAPVRALVLLDRQDTGRPEISPVDEGEMLKLIIRRNFNDEVPPPDMFDRFHAIARDSRRIRVRYTHGHQAIELLEREFGAGKD